MTHKYNSREKRARKKAKVRRKRERIREQMANAGKSKPAKEEKRSGEES